jgi:hypothetical protein
LDGATTQIWDLATVLPPILPSICKNASLCSIALMTSFQRNECALIRDVIHMKALERLWLVSDSCVDGGAHFSAVITSLQGNTTIEALHLESYSSFRHFFHRSVKDDFISMVRDRNFTLKTVEFDIECDKERAFLLQVEFYTKLNRLGRKALLTDRNTSKDDWIDILVASRDDIDVLFYTISKKPDLCV